MIVYVQKCDCDFECSAFMNDGLIMTLSIVWSCMYMNSLDNGKLHADDLPVHVIAYDWVAMMAPL